MPTTYKVWSALNVRTLLEKVPMVVSFLAREGDDPVLT
jgi:hypothetical protein